MSKNIIRAIFKDAVDDIANARRMVAAPDPNAPRYDPGELEKPIAPGKWPGYPDSAMPAYCPFRIIGRNVDGIVYCVTATGHLRALTRYDDVSLADLAAPFTNDIMHAWPAWSKPKKALDDRTGEMVDIPPKVVRLETKTAARAIINEAARLPDFDPHNQHRGRGGWTDKQDNFIWHSGRYLWMCRSGKIERAEPSMHDAYLYTRQQPTIDPWQESVLPDDSPANRILADLKTWQWGRPYLDPILMIGWLTTAFMGGALRARPIVFTTGGTGVGKSTLHELIKHVLSGAVMSTVDTSAAGIYQQIKQDSLPIMVDELESKANSSRAQSIIELARVAYTGGEIFRGGQDHEGTSFTMRSSFFFSAINPPPMKTQDKTRMAVLNLSALDKRDGIGRKMHVSKDSDGRIILRQILDGWHQFNNELIPYYWGILQEQGLDSRAIDTFGTLLAAAQLVIGGAAMEDFGLPITDPHHLGAIIKEATSLEREEQQENWHACLSHLLQSSLDNWKGGEKKTIGGLIDEYKRGSSDIGITRHALGTVNLGLKLDKQSRDWYLAVPKAGPGLKKIFAGEIWHDSVWWDALQQAPACIVIRDKGAGQKVKINGETKHCLLVNLAAFEEFTGDEK